MGKHPLTDARPRGGAVFLVLCLAIVFAAGCGKKPRPAKPVDVTPQVRLVKADNRDISRTIGQPGFIYAYEQTALYPKVTGYVLKWNVDIGDRIKKDQKEDLATLYVPELAAELEQKKAQVQHDTTMVLVAERVVETGKSAINEAAARVDQAKAEVNKYEASVERWESEVSRLTGLSGMGVVDKQVVDESRKQLKSDIASREAAKATVAAVQASLQARKSDLDKAQADVEAARAKTEVSRKDRDRVAALFNYTHIRAPYDGIVVVRNVNTDDYVQPATGDQSVQSLRQGGSSNPAPLYVVARTDVVRVYVDVPEMEADSIGPETEVRVRVQALGDEDLSATVTRNSWSLQRETRTLRAEVDLPNPDGRLRPNMYAYGRVLINRRNVRAMPMAAVVEIGNRNCCYLFENGKAVQTPVQTGINDGKWIEVAKKRVNGTWTAFTGSEDVILGDLSTLSDGQAVKVVAEPPANK
jgi:RND family efflux transporter MFP subunit